jgi:hypothetical protein
MISERPQTTGQDPRSGGMGTPVESELSIPIPRSELRIDGVLREHPRAPLVVLVHCLGGDRASLCTYVVGRAALEFRDEDHPRSEDFDHPNG